jgi:hypothetical protein
MNQRDRAEILWSFLQMKRVKGNKVQEIECIIDALIDCHADAVETYQKRAAELMSKHPGNTVSHD